MNLQRFLRECPNQKSQEIAMNIVLKGFYCDNEGILCVEVNNKLFYERARLNFDYKEINIRIATYMGPAVTIQVVVSSNDTNVFTLRLYHMLNFFSFGMKDLSVKCGTGTNTRYIPPDVGTWRCSVRKCLLKIFSKFTGKHLCQSLF